MLLNLEPARSQWPHWPDATYSFAVLTQRQTVFMIVLQFSAGAVWLALGKRFVLMRVSSDAIYLACSAVLRTTLFTLQCLAYCYGLALAIRFGLLPTRPLQARSLHRSRPT